MKLLGLEKKMGLKRLLLLIIYIYLQKDIIVHVCTYINGLSKAISPKPFKVFRAIYRNIFNK